MGDETSVISHGRDGKCLLWSLHKPSASDMLTYSYIPPSPLSGLALDGDGGHMIVGKAGGEAAIFNLDYASPVQFLGGHDAGSSVVCVDWHRTLNCCLSGSSDTTVRVSKLLKAV